MSLNIESRKTMYKFCLLLAEVWDPNCQTGASHQLLVFKKWRLKWHE